MSKKTKTETVAVMLRLPAELAQQLDAYVAEVPKLMRHPLIVSLVDAFLNEEKYPASLVRSVARTAEAAAKEAVMERYETHASYPRSVAKAAGDAAKAAVIEALK